jgi:hypothetical protein
MKERKALLEDAKAATHAALEEGIVPGGGVALIRCQKAVGKLDLSGDEKLGAEIVSVEGVAAKCWSAPGRDCSTRSSFNGNLADCSHAMAKMAPAAMAEAASDQAIVRSRRDEFAVTATIG